MFVDLWASWCVPCVGAFAYNKSIDSFLLANDIERLYISLDNNYKQWRKAIDKYQLGGFHIIANKVLFDDIKKMLSISGDIGIPIPHYLIFKSGELMLKNAASPVNSEQLFDELKNALKQ